MSVDQNKLEDDLEEGEIKDDAFEDISECSLSDILLMQQDLREESDVEQLREEALKSLQEDDEVTEEQLYRLEALKSLLVNIDSTEQKSTEKRPLKKRRKRKKKTRWNVPSKLFKMKNEIPEECDVSNEVSKELTPTNETPVSVLDMNILNKENKTADVVNREMRPWYPKTDSVLLKPCDYNISNEVKKQSELPKNDDFIPVSKVLSVTNADTRSLVVRPVTIKKQAFRCVKIDRSTSRSPSVVLPVPRHVNPSPLLAMNFSQYKNISKHHIRKYDSIAPTISRFSLRRVHKGKYKLVNSSRCALKNSSSPCVVKTEIPKNASKTVYSINRVKQAVPRVNPSEFIIELDDEDSGKESNSQTTGMNRNMAEELKTNNLNASPKNQLQDNMVSSFESESENNAEMCSLSDENIESSSSFPLENKPDINCIQTLLNNKQEITSHDSKFQSVTSSASIWTTNNDQGVSSPHLVGGIFPDIRIKSETLSDDENIGESISYSEEERDIKPTAFLHLQTENECMVPELRISETNACPVEDSANHSIVDEVEIKPSEDIKNYPITIQINQRTENNSIVQNIQSESEESSKIISVIEETVQNSEECAVSSPLADEAEPNLNEGLEMMEENDCSNESENFKPINKENVLVLADAEANLIKIRARLLVNLEKLQESIEESAEEKEKLNNMLKKLLTLKSMIFKFEDKIKLQQSKLTVSSNSMQSLFEDVVIRTETCAELKNECIRTGVEVMGPRYKPPDRYESLIDEKCRNIDFSKYSSTGAK